MLSGTEVWPHGLPEVGERAPVRPGDTITGEVEVLSVREEKPITRLAVKITRNDGTVVLDGRSLCYTMALP